MKPMKHYDWLGIRSPNGSLYNRIVDERLTRKVPLPLRMRCHRVSVPSYARLGLFMQYGLQETIWRDQ